VIEGDHLKNIELQAPEQNDHRLSHEIWTLYCHDSLPANPRELVQRYHQARFIWQESQVLFGHGNIRLKDRALIESVYIALCRQIKTHLRVDIRVHRQLEEELDEFLAEKLFVNFSVFQSLPDVWGIDQIFPIVPLSGLLSAPQDLYRVRLHDMTCDSDGRIDRYVDDFGIETTLPLPIYQEHQPYYLGFFLVGAYQEILGDMHNLFGDTDSVEISMDSSGVLQIGSIRWGDRVADVLKTVHFDPDHLEKILTQRIEAAQLSDSLTKEFEQLVKEGLEGYTYLE
jgi:arginine decarboxylase